MAIGKRMEVDLGGRWLFGYQHGPANNPPSCARDLRTLGLPIFSASVPGNFELDLQAAGIISDPFYAGNILELRKFEDAYVWYFREFEAPQCPDGDIELVFEGLDCYADIYLDGKHLASTANMLIEHAIPLPDLRPGTHELLVHIRPAVVEGKRDSYPPGVGAFPFSYESLYTRKAPHMYGWDIMPRAVSAGIWRPVKLRILPRERFEQTYLETTELSADPSRAELCFHYQALMADCPANYQIRLEGVCGESGFAQTQSLDSNTGEIRFVLDNPKLWWPRGRGEANLYTVNAALLRDGEEIDQIEFRHGIRSAALERSSLTTESGDGEFCFRVNGEKVFVLGTNWVPLDAFHSRDLERIDRALDMVADIGCNMIRCWGGNVYENDRFYERCDELGIMVWQDFAMACALYPEDSSFQEALEIEATSVTRRLRQHPCLILWAGDNECDCAAAQGWYGNRRDPNTSPLTRGVLPRVLAREDPNRPYLPSSPYIDPAAYGADERFLPENHLWGPRDYYKSDFYRTSLCHFASEIGYHGCPAPESIRQFISPDKLWPYTDNEEWVIHATNPVPEYDSFKYRVELMANQVRVLFGEVPDNLEEFAFASQASQAEAMKFFIELFRSAKWRRTGIIWWNLLDGWPQFSDAVVDYYFCKKLAYHVIRNAQQPLYLILQEPIDGKQTLIAANDTHKTLTLSYRVYDADTNETLAEGVENAMADQATGLAQIPYSPDCKRFLIIEWSSALGGGKSHYLVGTPPFDCGQYRAWLKRLALYNDPD